MKKCSKCELDKKLEEFAKDKHNKDGYTSACKDCRNKQYNERAKSNPEVIKEKNLKSKKVRQKYYQSDVGIKSSRRAHLKRTFGITLEEYDKLEKEQEKVCAICKKLDSSKRIKFLCVDHDHETNKIRGLLCSSCNRGLGLLKDNKEILLSAIKYLEKHE